MGAALADGVAGHAGSFRAAPIVHIHGTLLFSWCLLYLAQTAWIASGLMPTHRAWGMAGIALFTAMVCSILVTKVVNMRIDEARGFGNDGRRFAAIALCSVPMLVGLFAAAVAMVVAVPEMVPPAPVVSVKEKSEPPPVAVSAMYMVSTPAPPS